MKINIGLVFEQSFNDVLIQYSQIIANIYSSTYLLGVDSVPHATILQIDIENMDIDAIWTIIKKEISLNYKVSLAGLCLLPTTSDEVWIEIPILKSESIDTLQRNLVNLSIFKNKDFINGIEDNFRPHITVGYVNDFQKINSILPIPFSILRETSLVAKLTIGEVGENYTYKKVLKE